MKLPYLIQRVSIERYPRVNATDVDKHFGFDYMGSAEFEFGALPKALRAMRAHVGEYLKEPLKIIEEYGRIAWYVGPDDPDIIQMASDVFLDQSYGHKHTMRLKERTMMEDHYEPSEWSRHAPIGWWAIDQERPWLLFVKREFGQQWLECLRESAK